ncbi:GntR family transcriptional regulator [Streptomyces vinaceus]|uniref:GntR family transcriptional regulator n=1 Tax=Streptomyces vinaceus TaxID=1960 RepID=UPI0036A6F9FD
MIEFQVDRHSGVATYLQLVGQVKQALRLGVLEPGDRLPTARAVVEATAINPNTVLKAYRELEREGLVEPRPGQGTFVTRSLSRPEAAADSPLRADLVGRVSLAHAPGLLREDVQALVEAALAEAAARPPGPAGSAGAGTQRPSREDTT